MARRRVKRIGRQYCRGEQALYRESYKAHHLDFRAKGRDVIESGEWYQLRESPAPYDVLFEAENEDIDLANTVYWDVKD